MRATRSTLSRPLLLAALVCVGSTALAGNGNPVTVYKWVDAHGVVHYSDQPRPGAKKLQIAGAQTFSAPPAPVVLSSSAAPQSAATSRGYRSCTIAQPRDQQMLMNVYKATAVVSTDPPLRPGNRIRLFYDGRQLPGGGSSFTFPVNRGQHTVSAVVVDRFGQILCETSTVTFYVHQPSVLNPYSPLFHHPPPRPPPGR
jgi:hypothetical protein